jgi:hypothetical protein
MVLVRYKPKIRDFQNAIWFGLQSAAFACVALDCERARRPEVTGDTTSERVQTREALSMNVLKEQTSIASKRK